MRLWVLQVAHEGELSCSVHLTERGAATAAITDLLDFLQIEDELGAVEAIDTHFGGHEHETPNRGTISGIWDRDNLKDMEVRELWKVFRTWSQCVWDNPMGYMIEINSRMLEA